MKIRCPKCGYEWETRNADKIPKKCPRCQKRLDYIHKPIILSKK